MQCTAYTPLKLSHRYATEVDFQIYEMGPLAHYMAHDFFIPNLPLIILLRFIMNISQGCQLSRIWRDSHAFDLLLTHSRN